MEFDNLVCLKRFTGIRHALLCRDRHMIEEKASDEHLMNRHVDVSPIKTHRLVK